MRIADGPSTCVCLSSLAGLYTIPEVVLAIAADDPEELVNMELIGIDPTMGALAAETGLGLKAPNDGIVWWGMEAYAHPLTIKLAFVMGDAWNLYTSNETIWHYFHLLRPYANTTELEAACEALWPGTTSVLGPVTSYIYRTPDVALASALSYRPGTVGFQQHAWQATANGTALVFTTQRGPLGTASVLQAVAMVAQWLHEGALENGLFSSHEEMAVAALRKAVALDPKRLQDGAPGDDYADGYWTGSASMPRVGQEKDILIALYNPPFDGEPKEVFPPRTHAYFPKMAFDQVIDRLSDLGWILGRSENAFIALHSSSNNNTWQTTGKFIGVELIAEGQRASWVCVVGRAAIYGTFENFTSIILATNVTTVLDETMATAVTFPNGRKVTFGWGSTAFSISEGGASHDAPLSTLDRLHSPYATAPFPARDSLNLQLNNMSLEINFATNTRIIHDGPNSSLTGPLCHKPAQPRSSSSSASSLALLVAQRCLDVWNDKEAYPHFGEWGYEGGVVQLGLWEISAVLPSPSPDAGAIREACSAKLDAHMHAPLGLGYRILHDDRMLFPWGYSIGDHIALYPVAFAARARYSTASSASDPSSDVALCNAVSKRFVLGYPHRLADGTVSRSIGWPPLDLTPHNASAVWVDDSFMGTALITHSLPFLEDSDMYANYAATQLLHFVEHLSDPSSGLLHHGFDAARNVLSCCPWGRGNGWALMALMDLLLALPSTHPQYGTLVAAYKRLATAIAPLQNATDGRWHNVLTDVASPLETSSTSFYLYSFLHGVHEGWLDAATFTPVATRAFNGIAGAIASDGSVDGVVGETGVHATVEGYRVGAMPYRSSAPGLGAVMRALAAAITMLDA